MLEANKRRLRIITGIFFTMLGHFVALLLLLIVLGMVVPRIRPGFEDMISAGHVPPTDRFGSLIELSATCSRMWPVFVVTAMVMDGFILSVHALFVPDKTRLTTAYSTLIYLAVIVSIVFMCLETTRIFDFYNGPLSKGVKTLKGSGVC